MSSKGHTAVRLDNETLTRVDAARPLLDSQWHDATRSDVLRLLLLDGLQYYEKKYQTELSARPKQSRRGAAAPAPPARRSRKKSPLPTE